MIELLKVWITYAIWGALMYSLVFLWAVRSKQFTELDRQRRIALDAVELPEDEQGTPTRVDRYTWLGLIVLAVIVMTVVLVLGFLSAQKA